jgi:hypothetical protein
MASLTELPNLVGFFSYSRNDDEGDDGAVAGLANRIYRELRSQLGRTDKNFKLWRDKDALAAGEHWKEKLKEAVSESVFFIQMVTPSAVNSNFCRFEFERFIERERELGRSDLVFPILYISVPDLEITTMADPVISIVKDRQYADWRSIRHRDVNSTEVKQTVEQFCSTISKKLRLPWLSPEERQAIEEQKRAEEQRRIQEAEAKRQAEEQERQKLEETKRQAESERLRKEAEQAELKRREKEERERREQAAIEVWGTRKPDEAQRIRRGWEDRFKAKTQDKTSTEQDADVKRTEQKRLREEEKRESRERKTQELEAERKADEEQRRTGEDANGVVAQSDQLEPVPQTGSMPSKTTLRILGVLLMINLPVTLAIFQLLFPNNVGAINEMWSISLYVGIINCAIGLGMLTAWQKARMALLSLCVIGLLLYLVLTVMGIILVPCCGGVPVDDMSTLLHSVSDLCYRHVSME